MLCSFGHLVCVQLERERVWGRAAIFFGPLQTPKYAHTNACTHARRNNADIRMRAYTGYFSCALVPPPPLSLSLPSPSLSPSLPPLSHAHGNDANILMRTYTCRHVRMYARTHAEIMQKYERDGEKKNNKKQNRTCNTDTDAIKKKGSECP